MQKLWFRLSSLAPDLDTSTEEKVRQLEFQKDSKQVMKLLPYPLIQIQYLSLSWFDY